MNTTPHQFEVSDTELRSQKRGSLLKYDRRTGHRNTRRRDLNRAAQRSFKNAVKGL